MELINLSLVLISLGVFFMLLAVFKTRDLLNSVKKRKEINSWRILFFMMLFFLAGYLASIYLIFQGQQKMITFLTGVVYLLGAVFVFIISRLSSFTIKDLILKDKTDELNTKLKENETRIKQKSEELEHANIELEDERKQLEEKVRNRTSELIAVNNKLKNEIDEHKKSEKEISENKNRLQRQNKALHKVTKCFKLGNDNFTKTISKVTEIASETIEVDRVSVWLYDELKTNIRCIDLYERSKKTHSEGVILEAKSYPAYFKALELNRVIDANDAHKDSRTYEYSENYLTPLGISSMLDAPLRKTGKMIGIICFEHIGPQRIWTIDEQLFAGAIGDSISILLESIERITAERALIEKQKQLSSIYDTVGDSIFVLSVEKESRYKFVSINKAFETTTGLAYTMVVGKYVDEIVPHDALNSVLEKYNKAILDKKIVRWEEVSNNPAGKLTGEISVSPVFDENGNCTFLVGAIHDITDRKNAENKIRKLNEELEERVKERTNLLTKTQESLKISEEKYRVMVEEVGDCVYSTNYKGNFTFINPICEKLTGFTEKEILGKNFLDLIEPGWKEKVQKFYKNQFDSKTNETTFLFPIITKSGEKKWVEQIVTQQKDGDKIIGHQAIARDVTQRIKSEEELKQKSDALVLFNKELKDSEQQTQSLFNSAPDAVIVINNESGIIKWNHKAEILFGWDASEVLGRPLFEYIIPERYREAHKNGMKHYLLTGEGPVLNKEIEIEAVNKKGIEFSVLLSISPVEIKEKKLFIGFVRDITEKKKNLAALAVSENFLSTIIESIPNMIFVKDAKDLKFVKFNKAGEDLLGYSRKELMGKTDYDFFTKNEADLFTNNDRKVLDSGATIEIKEEQIKTKNKGERILETKKIPIVDSKGKPIYLLGISNDITERKKAEDQLHQIVESSPTALVLVDKEGKMILVNSQTEKLFGYNRKELIGQKVEMLIPKRFGEKHVEYRDEYFNNPKPRLMGTGRYLTGLRKNGTEISLEIGISPISTNQGIHVLATIIDISNLKKAEEEIKRKSEELARSNVELEQFAYVASHDLQEPLRMVTSYLQLLEKRYKDKLDKDATEFINYAVDGSSRMRTLILSLLDYSRINRVKSFEDIDVKELLKEVLNDLANQIKENNVTIKLEALPSIFGDRVLISQLFQNLISNAIKFKGEKNPEIVISGKKEGNEFLFSVKDNGIGIQKEYASKLFTIFQRLNTKENYPGTGIGLAICKKIVEKHSGKIWFESEFGKGSTFYFTLKEKEEKLKE